MEIQQFYDSQLAHASYALFSNGQVALVDPGRNPNPYIEFARERAADIVAIFETHPHADFVSSHMEFIKKHGAKVYIHPDVGVQYDHEPMRDGDEVKIGQATIRALFTPGHSPDHNSYLAIDKKGNPKAVFTGDSLFIGDVGRPDLREKAGNMHQQRAELAAMMYDTVQNVFKQLPDEVEVYPAHGAGSLCGKNMSDETTSTIGREKQFNWAMQEAHKDKFVETLLEGQPFIPKYFPYDVALNGIGAPAYEEGVQKVKRLPKGSELDKGVPVIDIRPADKFKAGHIPGAYNIQNVETDRFETWVGTLVGPDEEFYLAGDDENNMEWAIRRLAKIGYEVKIKATMMLDESRLTEQERLLDLDDFRQHTENYHIVDIRNESEIDDVGQFFDSAENLPLPDLRDSANSIPTDKPVVVHCAGGYRSAAGASILRAALKRDNIFDLSDAIEEFKEAVTA